MLFFYNNFNNSNIMVFASSSNDEIEQELEENINGILGDVDLSELDDFLVNDFELDFLNVNSFKELAVSVLNGNYFNEYNSLLDGVIKLLKNNIKNILSITIMFLGIVLLYEMFNNFCIDKYADLKKSIRIIFSFFIVLLIATLVKDVADSISETINKIFNLAKTIFPILLSLVSLSGAVGTYSVYNSLSLFLINTCSYIFVYLLLPIAVAIMVLGLMGSIFSGKRFEKTISIFKWVFKIIIGVMFAVFGLFSMVNLVGVGTKDGVTIKLTKFAIKNYVPVLGGYISEGFDFLHACSVLVKNAVGVCGVVLLFVVVLKPLVLYVTYIFTFKILALFVSYLGADFYSDVFENASKSLGCLVTVLVGLFLIVFMFIYLLIFSVSVV